MIFTILLIAAFISMAWPFILAMIVILVLLGVAGGFKMRRMARNLQDQMQDAMNTDHVWIDEEQPQDSPFEQRVDRPEVFDAEYTERGTEDDGKQSDTKGF